MRITKLEHSGVVVEKDGSRLVIDPGGFTRPLGDLDEVVGIVITHEHPDHWTPEQLAALLERNPDAAVFSTRAVADAADGVAVDVVRPGDERQAGPFELRFFGGRHAIIHSSIPAIDNIAVLVDGRLYDAGDSFVVPEGVDVEVLAVPVSAPWLKIGEVMDYVAAVAPRHTFPIHEAINSEVGNGMANTRVASVVESGGGQHHPLAPGDSFEV